MNTALPIYFVSNDRRPLILSEFTHAGKQAREKSRL